MMTRDCLLGAAALALSSAVGAQTQTNPPFGGLVPPGISTVAPAGFGPGVAPSTGAVPPGGPLPPVNPNNSGLLNAPPGSGTGGTLLNQPAPAGPQFQQPGPQFQQPSAPFQPGVQPAVPAPQPQAPAPQQPVQSFARPPGAPTAPQTLADVDAALRALDRERAARALAVRAEFEERRVRLTESEDWQVATGAERKQRLRALKKETLEREKRLNEEHGSVRAELHRLRRQLREALGR